MRCAQRDWKAAPNIPTLSLSDLTEERAAHEPVHAEAHYNAHVYKSSPTVTLSQSLKHTYTLLVSPGRQREEAVVRADLMSLNSLAPGPEAGQS